MEQSCGMTGDVLLFLIRIFGLEGCPREGGPRLRTSSF